MTPSVVTKMLEPYDPLKNGYFGVIGGNKIESSSARSYFFRPYIKNHKKS